ncbi:hypothetical protein A2U01_0034010 [Trifolium medium]|uniref:Uncharacterized protein n=1 Tax=Trifolium medium TaxID=97028 RepID=A0A392PM97_9FABA|nr:hypothetical protein [Trifolium medium]
MWLLDPSLPQTQDTFWRWIWCLKPPVNIQFFIWPVFKAATPCFKKKKAATPTRAVLKGWAWRFQIFASFVRLGLRVFFTVYSSVTARKQLRIFGRSNGVVVDGSIFMDSGLAGFGRLVRDQTGQLQGFYGSLRNFAADYLAKMGVNCGMRLLVMQEIPPDLSSILLADSLGVSSPRP